MKPRLCERQDRSYLASILVLETAKNVNDLKGALEPRGHKIISISTIADGMRLLRERSDVDLVVSAVHLVDESVFDFLKQIKADSELTNIPFVFLCTHASAMARFTNEVNKTASLILGACKYIVMEKFDADRLILEIESCLPENDS